MSNPDGKSQKWNEDIKPLLVVAVIILIIWGILKNGSNGCHTCVNNSTTYATTTYGVINEGIISCNQQIANNY